MAQFKAYGMIIIIVQENQTNNESGNFQSNNKEHTYVEMLEKPFSERSLSACL